MSSIEVLVKYERFNRRMTLPEGITLESFITEFKKEFAIGDIIPHDAEFLYQKFDSKHQDWVDMTKSNEEICKLDKIWATNLSADENSNNFPGVHPHNLKGDKTYRIWSLVSRTNASLMKRNDSTMIMKCDGSASDKANYLDIKMNDGSPPGKKFFRLELEVPSTPSKVYVITGTGENKAVTAQKVDVSSSPYPSNTKFEPKYFYSFTQFRCTDVNGEIDLYLASDENGNVTLAKAGQEGFPNPATLFICNQII